MTDERKGLIELGWFGEMPPSDPIAASASPRPDGWLDGEIELTALVLAQPDCDVKAVLRGFAEWILAAPKAHP